MKYMLHLEHRQFEMMCITFCLRAITDSTCGITHSDSYSICDLVMANKLDTWEGHYNPSRIYMQLMQTGSF